MDEEDGRLGPSPGYIIGNGASSAEDGTRQRYGFQDPEELRLLVDVIGVRARQTGRVDVLTDASTKSLCFSPENFKFVAGTRSAHLCFGSPENPVHSQPYLSQGELP